MLTPSLAAVPAAGFPYAHRDSAWRLARGVAKPLVASLGGMAWEELDRLIAKPAFSRLVRAYEAKELRSRADWRERLIRIAYEILERAALSGDLRAARFIVYESARGRDPGETVVAAVERAARRNARALVAEEPVPSDAPAEAAPAPAGTTGPGARLVATASRDRCLFRDAAAAEDLAATGLPAPEPRHAAPRKPAAKKAAAKAAAPAAASETTNPSEISEPLAEPGEPDASPPDLSRRPPRSWVFWRGTLSTAESSTTKTLPTPEPAPGQRQRDGP